MKMGKPRRHGKINAVRSRVLASEPSSPPRCKAMFAELLNYLDEPIDDSSREELEKHLDGCGPCKAFLASLQSTIESCRRLPATVPDRVKAAKLRREVMSRYERALAKRT